MFPVEVVSEPISLSRLRSIAGEQFGDLVKAVVDVERRVMVVGGAMHADEEAGVDDDTLRDAIQGIVSGLVSDDA